MVVRVTVPDPCMPGLSGVQHPYGALELEVSSVRHVDLDQEGGHGLDGRWARGRTDIEGNTEWVRRPERPGSLSTAYVFVRMELPDVLLACGRRTPIGALPAPRR